MPIGSGTVEFMQGLSHRPEAFDQFGRVWLVSEPTNDCGLFQLSLGL